MRSRGFTPQQYLLKGKVKYPVKGQNAQPIENCPNIKTDLDGLAHPVLRGLFCYHRATLNNDFFPKPIFPKMILPKTKHKRQKTEKRGSNNERK